MEEIIMNLILHSGEVRSYSMEAIQAAKRGNIEEAKELIKKADKEQVESHKVQTSLIQNEAAGNKAEVSLLLVHAQDHLMTSITEINLIKEMIDLRKELLVK